MIQLLWLVLLHAQVGSGVPLMGSTQGSPAASTVTNFRPLVLEVGKSLVFIPNNPVVIK